MSIETRSDLVPIGVRRKAIVDDYGNEVFITMAPMAVVDDYGRLWEMTSCAGGGEALGHQFHQVVCQK